MYEDIKRLGYICHLGSHQERQRYKDKHDLVFKVGVVTFLPKKDNDAERNAVIQLEPGWVRMDA